jgi:hypothetical protein
VALPDAPLDPSSAQEGRLIRRGCARCSPARTGACIACSSRAAAARAGSLDGAGAFLVRAVRRRPLPVSLCGSRYTRYWTVTQGFGRVARASGGWTAVVVQRAGTVVVAARFSLGRVFGQY